MPRSDLASITVTEPAADALRRLSYHLTAAAGRRVTLSDALAAACKLAAANVTAAAAALPDPTDRTGKADR
jgi:hypothetical protein